MVYGQCRKHSHPEAIAHVSFLAGLNGSRRSRLQYCLPNCGLPLLFIGDGLDLSPVLIRVYKARESGPAGSRAGTFSPGFAAGR